VVKKSINSYKNTRIKTVIRTLNIAILLTMMSVVLVAGMAAPAAATSPVAPAAVPAITSISPDSKNVGDATFTMTVTGTNFVTGSTVKLDGSPRPTIFVNSTSLNATILDANMTYAGAHLITVCNCGGGGGTSNFQIFTVNNLVPTTSSISPDSKNVGNATFTMTVTGTNFVSDSTVLFDGSDLATTYVSSTSLTATIPDTDMTTSGTHSIAVFNPTPGGGTSNSQTFTVILTLNDAIKYGADRLVETQKNDGTWQWSNPDTNPANTGYPAINNILGVTAKGLVRAYLATGNVSYLDAAKKTADLLVNKTPDGFGPDDAGTTGKHKVYGQDITFLMEFADAWTIAGHNGSTYSAKADDYMVSILNNANRFCATGCTNNASGLVQYNFNGRQPNLYGWDIEGWVEAAVRTGHTTFASEVVSNMSSHLGSLSSTATGTLGGTGAYYVLGLSGYLQSYILTGKTPAEYSAIKTQLLSELDTNGSFKIYAGTDDGIKQTAAYALMALNHTTTDMTGTVDYLVNSQSSGGIWFENDGTEYTEVDSEILTALVTTDNTKPVITLLGSSPVTVEAGSVYTDVGATALDNYDGVLNSSIVKGGLPVNTNVLGAHIVTYDVTDAHSNAAIQVTRTVNVVDTTPPVITLLGSSPVTVALGSAYTDAGATALDNYDGVLTSFIVTGGLPVDTNVLGTHIVTYDVTDTHSNPAIQVTRTVNVSGTLPSVRYINGTVIDSLNPIVKIPGVTVTAGILTTTTNATGFYSFAVPDGSYSLTATLDPTYYPNSSIPVSTVGKLVAVQNIKLVKKPTGNITGTVSVGV